MKLLDNRTTSLRDKVSVTTLYLEAYTEEAISWCLLSRFFFRSQYAIVVRSVASWLSEARQLRNRMVACGFPDGVLKSRLTDAIKEADDFLDENRKRRF